MFLSLIERNVVCRVVLCRTTFCVLHSFPTDSFSNIGKHYLPAFFELKRQVLFRLQLIARMNHARSFLFFPHPFFFPLLVTNSSSSSYHHHHQLESHLDLNQLGDTESWPIPNKLHQFKLVSLVKVSRGWVINDTIQPE